MPKNQRTAIPLCRSPFLQDVTIALGRRSLKGLRYRGSLEFELAEEDTDSGSIERLNIELRTVSHLTKISIWADGISWIYFADSRNGGVIFKKHANLAGMDIDDVAELLRSSLRDMETVKQIWERHAIPNAV